jgi:MgtE intracellular N domain
LIVTRQRRKPFPWRMILLPAIAIALIVFAFVWAPSRNVIANGPLSPMYRVTGNAFANVAQPFHFAAQNQVITDRNRQIAVLSSQLAEAQSSVADKEKQVASLQGQIDQLQAEQASSRGNSSPAPRPAASAAGGNAAAANNPPGAATAPPGAQTGSLNGDLSAGATTDMRRVGQYWASMDPENAAKIVERLPTSYVARVFALMSPDSVAQILDGLPPKYAAQLTQENPQIQR